MKAQAKMKENRPTEKRYRLLVQRSNEHTGAQIVEEETGVTIVTVLDHKVEGKTKTERARAVGLAIAKESVKKGVKQIVFDRKGLRFHGRVKAVAEGAREGGLNF